MVLDCGVPILDHMDKEHQEIINMIPDFDIVLIHTWNHPLLYDFLVRNELPPCRLIMWGHNSGLHAPNIYTKKILTYPDLFVFTTPLSYNVKDVLNLSLEEKGNLYDIWSTGGVDKVKNIKPKEHKGFNIGYIGTVDYAKMNPDFLKMCSKIDVPNVKFIVVGGLKQREVEEEAKKLGINNMTFTGIVPDLNPYLEVFDVFGYPLAPYHYGTCDITLQLAMASGIVPVVFNNPMEKSMVKNRETGIVVNNKDEYVKAIKKLHEDINLRKKLSDNARNYASETFSIKKLTIQWGRTFNKVLKFPKTIKKWDINKVEITPKDVFLESLGHYGKAFVNDSTEEIKKLANFNSWQTETKGSVHNYNSYFPNDPYLSKWSKLMKESL